LSKEKENKKISSKITLNLVAGNVFDIHNKFHDYGTLFGGFMEKNLGLLGHGVVYLSTPKFSPTTVCLECKFVSDPKKMVPGLLSMVIC